MAKVFKQLISVMKCVRFDTHLWCLSVIGGAVLLCVSFFVEPSTRELEVAVSDPQIYAQRKVIEYSSVLGSLMKGDIPDDEAQDIIESIPVLDDISSDSIVGSLESIDDYFSDDADNASGFAAAGDAEVDLSSVYPAEDIDALARLVQCEATSEDRDGKVLVASVVLNRVESGIWGDDIMSVIESPGQFAPVDNGAYKVTVADDETKDAVLTAIMDGDISHGALYFQKSSDKIWGNKQYLFRYGSHSFYK